MSETREIIDRLEAAYAEGMSLTGEYPTGAIAAEVGHKTIQKADALNRPDMTVEDAFEAARLYGQCEELAKRLDMQEEAHNVQARFAQVLSRTVLPNRDEGKLDAASRLRDIGDRYLSSGNRHAAAVELTNSALQILEMHNSTKEQIIEARGLLRKTRGMRAPHSVDFAYSELNLALAERQALQGTRIINGNDAYLPILASLDRAARIFKAFNERLHRPIYFQNVAEVLADWLSAEINISRIVLAEQQIPEGERPELFTDDVGGLAMALTRNPAVFGHPSVPDWVPTEQEILERALRRISKFDKRLKSIEDYIERSTRRNIDLRIKLFELRSMLVPIRGLPDPPFDAFDEIWEKHDYERYLMKAVSFLTWEGSSDSVSEQYSTLLKRLSICIRKIRLSWSDDDVERLLRRNPVAFRFASCELGRLRLWKDAFHLLELTRGLVASGTVLDLPEELLAPYDDGLTWGSPDVVVGQFRPGRSGQSPPRVSRAMAMSASGL